LGIEEHPFLYGFYTIVVVLKNNINYGKKKSIQLIKISLSACYIIMVKIWVKNSKKLITE
jgi:NADH:ubiquinone oxidoreductase subunit B-like Fe-S oxidoreductase